MIHWLLFVAFLLLGLLVGSQVNCAIYRLAWDPRPIGPWSQRHPKAPPRRWMDRVPVVGWLGLSRESSIHGANFWLRPLLIEVCFGVGFAGLWMWHMEGGLLPAVAGLAHPTLLDQYLTLVWIMVLIALMSVATFIDFDEKYIPDAITFPGTWFALAWLTLFPQATLPVFEFEGLPPQATLTPLRITSPQSWPDWLDSWRGMLAGQALIAGWCIALLPTTRTRRYGWRRGLALYLASVIRPRRTARRQEHRRGIAHSLNRLLLVSMLVGMVAVPLVWWWGGEHWRGLLTCLVGLGFGGGVIWAIRLIGAWTLKREAMGFGDVTLLSMIGAFLGWQGALMVLFLAPFAAVFIALAQFVLMGNIPIAFGPYLCLGAFVLLWKWSSIWPTYGDPIFAMGTLIPEVVVVCLALMGVMLFCWQKIKVALFGIDEDEPA